MKNIYFLMLALFAFNQSKSQWINQTASTTNSLNSVYFVNADTGYIAVNHYLNPAILKTVDGGVNWTTLYSSSLSFYCIYFFNTDIGFASGNQGTIMKTIDGGLNWTSATVNTIGYNSVFMTSGNNGCAVGGDGAGQGAIIRTTNGGLNWTSYVQTPTLTDLNSICFSTANRGYAVGSSGTILKTTNGGVNWTFSTSGITSTLNSVFFTDSITGYAVGGGGKILKTINGGSNWTAQVSNTINTLRSVYFINSNTGFVVGSAGTILKTTNGGDNWITDISNTSSELRSVHFPNINIGYAVGASGTILKSTSSTTINEQINYTLINVNIFPNPVKNILSVVTTKEINNGTIVIYNINMQEILRQYIQGDKNQIEVSNLTKGVYFIKIITDKLVEIKKIVKE